MTDFVPDFAISLLTFAFYVFWMWSFDIRAGWELAAALALTGAAVIAVRAAYARAKRAA